MALFVPVQIVLAIAAAAGILVRLSGHPPAVVGPLVL